MPVVFFASSPPLLRATMPFGSQASLDFFDELPPIETTTRSRQPSAGQSLFEGMESLRSGRSVLYRLCLVDEEGRPLNIPTEQDLQSIVLDKPKTAAAPLPREHPPEATTSRQQQQHQQHEQREQQQQQKEPSFQELLAETHAHGGPVCSHCHAT